MDTKSKNSKKWLGNLLCILVVVVLAAGTIICYPRLRMGAEERMNVYRDRAEAETSANLGEDQPIEAETETDTESDVQLEVYYENPYVETKDFVYKNSYDEWIYVSWRTVLAESGLPILVGCVTVLLALAALLLPLIPSLGVGTGIFGKMPLELNIFLALSPLYTYYAMLGILSDFFFYSDEFYMLEQFSYLIQFGLWTLLYSFWFVAVLSFRAVVILGPKRYFLERVWTVQLVRWFWKTIIGTVVKAVRWIYWKIKGFFRLCAVTLEDIDLTSTSDRILFKVLGLNLVIVLVCCILGNFGVMALLVYTVILFFVLKKYTRVIRSKYQILLESTRKLAAGDLETVITEDAGIFEPLKQELNKVQAGFQKAVEEELKSQNMKSELITNVSHDLKTPLTAIITYVNLLKDETISEEDRKKYIDILDRKSLRLKQLIEDLFEVSKANSGNIKIEKKMLNLTELVRQAAFELEDRLKEAQIDCRVSVPEKEIHLELDGEKTYRCLENLLTNVCKYALPGTRAYLNLYDKGDQAEIVLKNISRDELTMDVEELTERFMRGDKSRNTEGSGLGLAIVKSFVELQGGSFHIEADGDLFKARMSFPKTENSSTGAAEVG